MRHYLPLVLTGVAFGMHLAVGGVYVLSLLLVPGPVVAVLAFWWLVLLGAGAALAIRRSPWVLAVPLVATGSWAAVVGLGDRLPAGTG